MSERGGLARRRGRRRSGDEWDQIIQDRIFEAALGLVRRSGFAELTCANLADLLHIRVYSLLKLIGGLDQVRDRVALQAIKELTEVTAAAVHGRTGRDAVLALVDAQRLFALAQPGLYSASQSALSQISPETSPIVEALAALELGVFKTYGAVPAQSARLAWCMRASVRGAISLELSDKRTRCDEIDECFDHLVELLDAGARLAAPPRTMVHASFA